SAAMGLLSAVLLQKLWRKERTGRRTGILSPIFLAGSGWLTRRKKKGFYLQTYGAAGTQTSPIAAESLCSCCLEAGRGRRLICVYLQVRRGSTGFPGGMDAASFFKNPGQGRAMFRPGIFPFRTIWKKSSRKEILSSDLSDCRTKLKKN
ncbi:MAG: hypothetical protein IKI23_11995, partial [Lachnospiraceae bacterium]|nr:hypothetical protein [Lachnospiraceae bacterium]